MKKEKIILALILFSLFLLGFYGGIKKHYVNKVYIFQTTAQAAFPVTTEEIDLPLPVPSSISTEKGQVRLDLEKIAVNRFFIIYSIVYGDQSHTAYHLYLTDLEGQTLDKEGLGDIYLQAEDGEIIKPVAQLPVVEDFPGSALWLEDQDNRKIPYQTQRSSHSLVLHYLGEKFVLTDIAY